MTLEQLYEKIEQIGLLTFSTIHNGEVHSRIAHFNGYDDEGLFFRTMDCKPYGRQLKAGGKVTVCGNYGGTLESHEIGAPPSFAPGFSLRIIGEICFVSAEDIIEGAKTNKFLEVAARDIESYPAMAKGNYKIVKAKCEIFDYDFEKLHRPEKLLRTRWSFGGMPYNDAGARIDAEKCIGCGICEGECSFGAIAQTDDGTYKVISSHCDECGSCIEACPSGAISNPLTF